ncbi:MAG: endonuclease III, partial [Chlamydiia bacterium]|nr:endonuclease III [Chlamydiia bacterium]
TLLIAVLLSAQCTDVKVNQVTPKLFALADTPETMALLSPEEIEKIIRPCGLAPTKSKAIHQLSLILAAKYRGKVPSSFKALEKLPGVGHKTASVIMIQAFHKPAFPVDTHIFRAAHRWHLSEGKTVKQVEEDVKKLFPKKEWARRHLQIIYFCRNYCPARGHNPQSCPICSLDLSFLPSEVPKRHFVSNPF